jgi:hypothetical protein
MGFQTKYYNSDQITHKSEILRLIRETNKAFATFDTAPTLLDEWTKQTSFIEQAHKGKTVALAVQILYVNSRSILPKEFFKKETTTEKYDKAFTEPYTFLSEDAVKQYKGILLILDFYQELLDALYSLPDFSDTIQIYQKKDRKRTNLEEEDPFEY